MYLNRQSRGETKVRHSTYRRRSKSLDYEPKHIAHTLEPYTYIACSIADALYSALFSRHQIVPDMHQEQGYKTEQMNEVE